MVGWSNLAFGLAQSHWETGPSSCVGNECNEFPKELTMYYVIILKCCSTVCGCALGLQSFSCGISFCCIYSGEVGTAEVYTRTS